MGDYDSKLGGVCTCWREGHDGVMADCDIHRPTDDTYEEIN